MIARFDLRAPELLVDQVHVLDSGSGQPIELIVPFIWDSNLFRWCPDHIEQGSFRGGERGE